MAFLIQFLRCFLISTPLRSIWLSHCTFHSEFNSKATPYLYGTHQIINITTFICRRQSFIFLFFWRQELKKKKYLCDTDKTESLNVNVCVSKQTHLKLKIKRKFFSGFYPPKLSLTAKNFVRLAFKGFYGDLCQKPDKRIWFLRQHMVRL